MDEALRLLRADVARLNSKLDVMQLPLPHLCTMKRAARELDISLRKLSALVKSGAVLAVDLGQRKMVPASEIRRVAIPAPKARRRAIAATHAVTVEALEALRKKFRRR